jgi:pyruvate formate lyase activating enzyme
VASCAQGAIRWDGDRPVVDHAKCILSGACVAACYAEARQIAGRKMTVAQVMSEVERDIPFYDELENPGDDAQPVSTGRGGVTFSGGEPLLQAGFLLGLLTACKTIDVHTALDTSGFATWETLDRVRSLVDLFLYDIKLMDPLKHRKFTLTFNTRILENIQRLARLGHNITVRVPIIPGINDDRDNLQATGAFVAGLGGTGRVDLLPYHHAAMSKYERLHRTYRLPWLNTPSDERLAEIAHIFESYGLHVHVGG